MNLLILVLLFLLLFAQLGSQAFDRLISHEKSRFFWQKQLVESFPCIFNGVVKKELKNLVVRSSEANKPSNPASESSVEEAGGSGSSSINFRLLVDAKFQEHSAPFTELAQQLAKALIRGLYQEQPFFQALVRQQPDILEHLLEALVRSHQERPIKKVEDLKRVSLESGLQDLWYQLLRENPLGPVAQAHLALSGECLEVSFLDYLNNSSRMKIRPYLAPRALLYALYGSHELVKQVVDLRQELYKLVTAKELTNEEATARFQADLAGRSSFDLLIDFTVTKTNPKDYEEV